jgi:hypothetical protein
VSGAIKSTASKVNLRITAFLLECGTDPVPPWGTTIGKALPSSEGRDGFGQNRNHAEFCAGLAGTA